MINGATWCQCRCVVTVNDEATEVELGKHISLVGQSNLRIDDVWERYEGAYVCTASNGEGSVVTAQAQLTVLGNYPNKPALQTLH